MGVADDGGRGDDAVPPRGGSFFARRVGAGSTADMDRALRRSARADAFDLLGREAALGAQRYQRVLGRAHMCYEREQAKRSAELRVPNLVSDLIAPDPAASSARRTGRERMAILKRTLDGFGLDRSDTQRDFHNQMAGACAGLIFKDDLESEIDDLLVELQVERLVPQFMAITPRRWGKTYSVAMFVVAMALAVEGLEQSIFSTGRRASQKLLELIYTFICRIPGMEEMIIKHNVETIEMRGPDGDIRKISSYPSKVKISRARAPSPFVCASEETDRQTTQT